MATAGMATHEQIVHAMQSQEQETDHGTYPSSQDAHQQHASDLVSTISTALQHHDASLATLASAAEQHLAAAMAPLSSDQQMPAGHVSAVDLQHLSTLHAALAQHAQQQLAELGQNHDGQQLTDMAQHHEQQQLAGVGDHHNRQHIPEIGQHAGQQQQMPDVAQQQQHVAEISQHHDQQHLTELGQHHDQQQLNGITQHHDQPHLTNLGQHHDQQQHMTDLGQHHNQGQPVDIGQHPQLHTPQYPPEQNVPSHLTQSITDPQQQHIDPTGIAVERMQVEAAGHVPAYSHPVPQGPEGDAVAAYTASFPDSQAHVAPYLPHPADPTQHLALALPPSVMTPSGSSSQDLAAYSDSQAMVPASKTPKGRNVCKHPDCTKWSTQSANGPRMYCNKHMREHGQVPKVYVPPCLVEDCGKKAQRSTDGARIYCLQHLREHGQDLKVYPRKPCQQDGCARQAQKNTEGEKVYCAEHMRMNGMIPVLPHKRCQHTDCPKFAQQSTDGKFMFCKAHMRCYGQIPLRSYKVCQHEGCSKFAKPSTDGQTLYCILHMKQYGLILRTKEQPLLLTGEEGCGGGTQDATLAEQKMEAAPAPEGATGAEDAHLQQQQQLQQQQVQQQLGLGEEAQGAQQEGAGGADVSVQQRKRGRSAAAQRAKETASRKRVAVATAEPGGLESSGSLLKWFDRGDARSGEWVGATSGGWEKTVVVDSSPPQHLIGDTQQALRLAEKRKAAADRMTELAAAQRELLVQTVRCQLQRVQLASGPIYLLWFNDATSVLQSGSSRTPTYYIRCSTRTLEVSSHDGIPGRATTREAKFLLPEAVQCQDVRVYDVASGLLVVEVPINGGAHMAVAQDMAQVAQGMPHSTQDMAEVAQGMHQDAPQDMEQMAQGMPQDTPQEMEQMAQGMPQDTPQEMEQMAQGMPQDTPQELEQMAQGMPESAHGMPQEVGQEGLQGGMREGVQPGFTQGMPEGGSQQAFGQGMEAGVQQAFQQGGQEAVQHEFQQEEMEEAGQEGVQQGMEEGVQQELHQGMQEG